MAANARPVGPKTVFVSGDAVAPGAQARSHEPPWLNRERKGPQDVFRPRAEPFEAGKSIRNFDRRTIDVRSETVAHAVRSRLITEAGYWGTVLREYCRKTLQRVLLLVQPAEGVGYRFENNATVNGMMQFLEASPNGLPLLQFAAAQPWEHRDPVRHLMTENSYRGMRHDGDTHRTWATASTIAGSAKVAGGVAWLWLNRTRSLYARRIDETDFSNAASRQQRPGHYGHWPVLRVE